MRWMLTVGLALGLVSVLVACGSGNSDNTLRTGTTGTSTAPGIPPAPIPTPTPTLQDGTGTGMSARELAFASDLFRLVNEYRQANGLNQLAWNPVVARAAQDHTIDMQTRNILTHDGPPPCVWPANCPRARLEAVGMLPGVDFTAVGENVGYGAQTAEEAMAAFRASPDHDVIMLDPIWTHMGVGYRETVDAVNPANTAAWWTQGFTTQP